MAPNKVVSLNHLLTSVYNEWFASQKILWKVGDIEVLVVSYILVDHLILRLSRNWSLCSGNVFAERMLRVQRSAVSSIYPHGNTTTHLGKCESSCVFWEKADLWSMSAITGACITNFEGVKYLSFTAHCSRKEARNTACYIYFCTHVCTVGQTLRPSSSWWITSTWCV